MEQGAGGGTGDRRRTDRGRWPNNLPAGKLFQANLLLGNIML
jgi:hypothetical protein